MLSTNSQRLFSENIVRPLEIVYGPGLVALFFAASINMDPSIEVIYSSFSDFDSSMENGLLDLDSLSHFLISVLRVSLLASVPATIYACTRWALREVKLDPDGKNALPRLFAAITWMGYVFALFRGLGLASGGAFASAWFYWIATTGVFTVLMVCFLWMLSTQWHPPTRRSKNLRVFLIAVAVVFVLANVLWPSWSAIVGPLAVAAAMLALFAVGLAGLSVWSSRTAWMPVPAVLVLFWLAVLASGPRHAVILIGIIAIFGLATVLGAAMPRLFGSVPPTGEDATKAAVRFRDLLGEAGVAFMTQVTGFLQRAFSWTLKPVGKTSLLIAAGSAAFWGLHQVNEECSTLSGCNIERGKPFMAEPYHSPDKAPRPDVRTLAFVAAKGGGLYAAYHSAYYLASIADQGQARDLYLVSGVSGGAVGAGVFWAVHNSGLCDARVGSQGSAEPQVGDEAAGGRCRRAAVKQILGKDYLSPALATLLTRDLADTIVPFSSVFTYFDLRVDRGSVFENAIRRAYQAWYDQELGALLPHQVELVIEEGRYLLDLTLADAGRLPNAYPYLVFNGVDVDTGQLVPMSMFGLLSDDRPGRIAMPSVDLTVLQAMVASARFPVVTPPLRVDVGNEASIQITDGGYFDNSGLDSIWDVVSGLAGEGSLNTSETVDIIILSNEHAVLNVPVEEEDATAVPNGFPETDGGGSRIIRGTFGSVLSSFLGSWQARQALLQARFNDYALSLGNHNVCYAPTFLRDDLAGDFTLSWFLAEETFQAIEDAVDRIVSKTVRCIPFKTDG